MKRLQIAFLTSVDAASPGAYSGTPYYMARALHEYCGDVTHLGPLRPPYLVYGKVRNRLSQRLLGRPRPFQHSLALARGFGRRFRARIPAEADVVFAPFGAAEIAFLETDVPIVYASDATLPAMRGYYAGFGSGSTRYDREADEVERRALEKAAAAVYPSRWALRSARDAYGLAGDKLHLVRLGANLNMIPPREAIVPAKRGEVCRVLLLGVDWERKGGPTAFAAVARLREDGVDARLTVCGCTPPPEYQREWVRVIPRLDKAVPGEEAALSDLLLHSHFLVLPTRAECFGIAFCEASAHGTPSLAPDTGGVSDAVLDGRNGFLLPDGAPPEAYAARILEVFRTRSRYLDLAESSRAAYESELNWRGWAERLGEVIARVV